MVYEWRHQPFKAIYIIYGTVKLLALVPFWFLRYALPILRPRRSWSLQKCLTMRLVPSMSAFGGIQEKVGLITSDPTWRAVAEGPGIKGVWVDPVPHLIAGKVKTWAAAAGVEPARIPGYWADKAGQNMPVGERPAAGEKVVYYIHGGAFICLSAHPDSWLSAIPRRVLDQCPTARRSFSIEYRLSDPSPDPQAVRNPFPAGLIDIIAGYAYLVDVVGFAPEDIIVVGDSAGGNLALAFARYLVDNIAELSAAMKALGPLPPVYHLTVFSPWADLGTSHEGPGSSLLTNTYDMLPDVRSGLFLEVRKVYAGPLGLEGANSNPYLSPASTHPEMTDASFKGFPPTFISAGGMERFIDQCRTLVGKMRADLGEDNVKYVEEPDACHDVLVLESDEQREDTMKAIAQWLA